MSIADVITSRLATRRASDSGMPSIVSSASRTRTVASIAAGRICTSWLSIAAMRGRNSAAYAAMSSFSYVLRRSQRMARSSSRATETIMSSCALAGSLVSSASISLQIVRKSNESRMMMNARATSAGGFAVSSHICQANVGRTRLIIAFVTTVVMISRRSLWRSMSARKRSRMSSGK
jgi:hypothetical protein